jgi:hypothetical protein
MAQRCSDAHLLAAVGEYLEHFKGDGSIKVKANVKVGL